MPIDNVNNNEYEQTKEWFLKLQNDPEMKKKHDDAMKALEEHRDDAMAKFEQTIRPKREQQITQITEEPTPIKLDLELTPKEEKQAITELEQHNIFKGLLDGSLKFSPRTTIYMAIASLITFLITKFGGC